MDIHPSLVFLHVLSAVGVFAALGIEGVALPRLRRAEAPAGALTWVELQRVAGRLASVAMAVLLVTGIWLTMGWWGRRPWIAASFIGMVVMGALGGAVTMRELRKLAASIKSETGASSSKKVRPSQTSVALSVSFWIRISLGVAIIALMTIKPNLVASVATLIGAITIGTIAARIPVFAAAPVGRDR